MALTLEIPSTTPGCGEPGLIAAARAGDDRAFEQLYARYRERIEAFILGRVRDHGRAEDIAQEVFMSALRRLRANEQEIAFKPWIYEIAKNACIDEFRRAQRSREVSLDADESLNGDRGALLSIAPSPPAAVENKQRLDDLRGAFGGLSDVHHKLLVMRELEGLSYDEIGSRMGMSRQVVESTLFRARRKLSAEYEELASGRRCQQIQSVIADGRAVSSRALGVREHRQLARHLAHCQPCRITAHLAGVDESLVRPRTIATKLAGLLPFPIWRWLGRPERGLRQLVARKGAHPATGQNLVALADQAQSPLSLGGAAVAAAVVALAGAGGAVVAVTSHESHARRATPPGTHAGVPAAGLPGGAHATAVGGAGRVSTGGLGIAARHATGALVVPSVGSRPGRPATHTPVRGSSGTGGGGATSTGASSGTSGGAAGAAGSAASAATSVSSRVPLAGTTQSTGSSLAGTAGNTVSQVTQGVGSTVTKVVNTVSGAVNSATGTASSVTGAVGNTVSNVGSTVSSTVGSTVGSALGGSTGTTAPTSGATSGSGTGPLGSTGWLDRPERRIDGLEHRLAPDPLDHRRTAAPRRAANATAAVEYWLDRGVAQPGSAHRSGR